MQTILGAGGVIGNYLAKSLLRYTDKVRLVSRKPAVVVGNEDLFPGDITDPEKTDKAVEGSDVVYLTVGLPYDSDVWKKKWPVIMKNTIEACKKHEAKLVFFDNVYMYGNVDGWMTEETPFNPCSKKGEVRARIATMLLDEIKQGNLTAQIARAADFYGPKTPKSFVTFTIFDKLSKGKKAQIMENPDAKHSLSYTPDCGEAVALLGNTDTAYDQTWHLPSDMNVLTHIEMVELAAKYFRESADYTIVKKWMVKLIGLFSKEMKENAEMFYQYNSDYLFDSSKFDNSFKFNKTKHDKGFKETVKSY